MQKAYRFYTEKEPEIKTPNHSKVVGFNYSCKFVTE